MQIRRIVAFLLTAFFSFSLFAEEHQIVLNEKIGHCTGSRTNNPVTASIDADSITVRYYVASASKIIIYNSSDSQMVFSYRNDKPSNYIQADISSLSSGEYIIEVYALNIWWIGHFDIE